MRGEMEMHREGILCHELVKRERERFIREVKDRYYRGKGEREGRRGQGSGCNTLYNELVVEYQCSCLLLLGGVAR